MCIVASLRTALCSVRGISLITDSRDGQQHVGKVDGDETILQRWRTLVTNCHDGNVELKNLNPKSFRFSLLRVLEPKTLRVPSTRWRATSSKPSTTAATASTSTDAMASFIDMQLHPGCLR